MTEKVALYSEGLQGFRNVIHLPEVQAGRDALVWRVSHTPPRSPRPVGWGSIRLSSQRPRAAPSTHDREGKGREEGRGTHPAAGHPA